MKRSTVLFAAAASLAALAVARPAAAQLRTAQHLGGTIFAPLGVDNNGGSVAFSGADTWFQNTDGMFVTVPGQIFPAFDLTHFQALNFDPNLSGTALAPLDEPCGACGAAPNGPASLFGNAPAPGLDDYLAGQRKILAAQRAGQQRAKDAYLKAEAQRLAAEKELSHAAAELEKSEKNKDYARHFELQDEVSNLQGALLKREQAERAARSNVKLQDELVDATLGNISRAKANGAPPTGGLLTQFGGGATTGQEFRYRGGERSTYNRAVKSGKGISFKTEAYQARDVDRFLNVDWSQVLRGTTGHAQSGPGRKLPEGVSSAYQDTAALFGMEPAELTYRFMVQGLLRNLRNAVEKGDVPGTIERVGGELGTDQVHIPPEGLEKAKPYLDVLDSLFEGLQEEFRNTTSPEEARKEKEEREYLRKQDEIDLRREAQQRDRNPVNAKDIEDNTGEDPPDGVEEAGKIVPLA